MSPRDTVWLHAMTALEAAMVLTQSPLGSTVRYGTHGVSRKGDELCVRLRSEAQRDQLVLTAMSGKVYVFEVKPP